MKKWHHQLTYLGGWKGISKDHNPKSYSKVVATERGVVLSRDEPSDRLPNLKWSRPKCLYLWATLVIEILRAWRKAEPPSLRVAAFLSLLANFLPASSFWPWLCHILVEIKTNTAKCPSHKHKILCLFTHHLSQGASPQIKNQKKSSP